MRPGRDRPRAGPGGLSARVRSAGWPSVDRRLDEQAARQAAARRGAGGSSAGRDEVLFRGTQPVDDDAPANLRAAREAARAALDAVGLSGRVWTGACPRSGLHGGGEAGDPERGLRAAPGAGRRPAQPWPQEPPGSDRGRLDEALRILDHAATLRPPSRAYHLRRAQILALRGDAAGAGAEQTRAEARPPSGALDAFLAGVDRFMGARATERAGLSGPSPTSNEPCDCSPTTSGHATTSRSRCLNSDRPDAGHAYLNACLGQRPDWVWAYLLRGSAAGRLGQFDDAEADFRKAEQLHPNREALHALFINRGTVRYEEGKLDEADRDFERAIATAAGPLPGATPTSPSCGRNRAGSTTPSRSWTTPSCGTLRS